MTTEQLDNPFRTWTALMSSNSSAVQDFADRLRDEKDRAQLSFREIAGRAFRDHTQMVRAANGKVLPTWDVTRAFLLGCSVPRHQVEQWHQFWSATHNFLSAEQQLHTARVELSVGTSVARRGVRLTKDWLEVQQCNTPAQFGVALRGLLELNGLSLTRQAAMVTGVPKSTLADWIEGKTVPTAARLDQLLQRVGASPQAQREFAACLERIRERRWSPAAVDHLRDLYPRHNLAALVLKLGKSEAVVREKIEELDLPPRPASAS
jgi:transcriptional regulator with XRE-family HTH domain